MPRVVIGVDPHKASNTLVVIDAHEQVVAEQRFVNDRAGYRSMKTFARSFTASGPGRWKAPAVSGPGWPSGWSPRTSRSSTCLRSCRPGSARSAVAAAARPTVPTRSRWPWPACAPDDLRAVRPDDVTEILRMLTDRRQELVRERIATVNRLHEVLTQLIPGGARKNLRASTARRLLSSVRPRAAVGKARKQLALDYVGDLERLDTRLKELKAQIAEVGRRAPEQLADEHRRGRPTRCRQDPRRGDRRAPVPVQGALRQLHRHRTHRRVLRGQQPAPAQPRRQPPAQPCAAHRGHHPVPGCPARARTTTGASATRARPTSKRCAASNGDSPTSSTDTSSTTWQQGAREDKWGRLFNPARLT